MKRIELLIFFFLLSVSPNLYSQVDTSTVEQYCEVVATGRLLSNKVTIEVDFGEFSKLWSDQRIKDESGKVKKFNSLVDALNYMGSQNWKLTTALLMGNGPYVYHYMFRRAVPKSELKD